MLLELHEIIDIPGASAPFSCTLETDRLFFPSVSEFLSSPYAEGRVVNSAGALSLEGRITAKMLCVCDRCGEQFELDKSTELNVPLAAELEDEENPDIFLIENSCLDLDEALGTCFILDMDAKLLCSEDCKGLCARCGANLNHGPCSCGREIDPRMAVLGQLLDNKEDNN